MRIAILGAGVIGTTAAYHLTGSEHPEGIQRATTEMHVEARIRKSPPPASR